MMNADPRSKRPKVHELAAALGLPPRTVVIAARELGIPVQNRLTRVTTQQAEQIRAHFAKAPDAPAD